MQGNAAAMHRTYERNPIAVEKQQVKPLAVSFIDKVMKWMVSEEPAGQRIACYGFLTLTAFYFIGSVLRAVF